MIHFRLGPNFYFQLNELVKVVKNLVIVYCQMRNLKYDFKSNIDKKREQYLPSTSLQMRISIGYFHSLIGRDG